MPGNRRFTAALVKIRQSDLKSWATCPLQYRYSRVDQLPRVHGAALTFGSIIHDCIYYLETTGDLISALARFHDLWNDPTQLGPEYKIDEYHKGASWKKYAGDGDKILRDWWPLFQWDPDVVLAREYHFEVPVGDGHVLDGTIDKLVLRFSPKHGRWLLVVEDYKTNAKLPTYDYLAEDLQFTAYAYATTRPEFWTDLPDGARLFAEHQDTPRWGEWIALKGPRRMDAGERTHVQYNRLAYAVNALAESVAMRIFVPNITGESCRYCPYRDLCGLAPIAA